MRRPPFAAGPLYPIIDASDPLVSAALVDAVLQAGVPWLQLRCKGVPAASFLRAAHHLVTTAARAGARVIVNDRLDVALASGADGLHIGQDDLPLADARRIAGDALVIGVSTHDVDEARAAEDGGADYIGFGPMYPTTSKPDAHPQRTLEALAHVRAAIRLPIVAIGGIGESTASTVLAAGADTVAVIGALASAPDPRTFAARITALRTGRS